MAKTANTAQLTCPDCNYPLDNLGDCNNTECDTNRPSSEEELDEEELETPKEEEV